MIEVPVKQADYSLQLGRRGENGVRALVFDFADWLAELGPGVVEIVARRASEQTAYPVKSEQQGSTVRWIVSATDTACPGYGEAQLIYRIGGQVAKTRKYNTYTAESITWPEDVPGPDQQFLDQMLTMSATAKAGAERAEQAAGRSEQILTETAGLKEQTTVDRKAAEAAKDDATKQAQAAARQAEEADRQRQDAVTAAGQAQGAATAAGKSEGAAQEAAKKTGEDLLATTTAKETAEKAAQKTGQDLIDTAAAKQTAIRAAQNAEEAQRGAIGAAGAAGQAQKGAEKAQKAIEDLSVSAKTVSPDALAQAVKTVDAEGAVHLELRIPKGEQGETGPQGPVGGTAPLDDTAASGQSLWSSLNIVKQTADRLCSPFQQKGPIVQGELVAGYPMTVKSYIEPVQDGEGDPSPENRRPIHGATELQAFSCGKNLINQNIELNWVDKVNVTAVKNEDGSIHVTANGKQSTTFINISNIRYSDYGINHYVANEKGFIASKKVGFDANNNLTFIVIDSGEVIDETFYPQIEKSSAATEYEPYHGSTFTQILPEEIMKAVYEWNNGKLTVLSKAFDFKVSEMNNSEDYPGWTHIPGLSDVTGTDFSYKPVLRCDSGEAGINAVYSILFLIKPKLTQTQWKSQHPDLTVRIEVPYREDLRPVIQLPKHLILAQPGITTVYSNAAETEVQARKDPSAERAQMQRDIAALQKSQTNL